MGEQGKGKGKKLAVVGILFFALTIQHPQSAL